MDAPSSPTPTLPLEILARIINLADESCLYPLSLVNTFFHSIANPILWRSVCLSTAAARRQYDPSISFFYALVTTSSFLGEYIRTIQFDQTIDDNYLLLLMKYSRHIEHVSLSQAESITDNSIQHIAYWWPNISSLQLTNSPITQFCFNILGRECHRLTQISLLRCPHVRPDTISRCFSSNSTLKSLTVDISSVADDDQDLWLTETCDIRNLRALTHLQLHGLPYGIFVPTAIRRSPVCWFPDLTKLHLDECFHMGDEQVIPLLEACSPRLTDLVLMDMTFSDTSLAAIARRKRQLITLNISYNHHISARGVRQLIRDCTQLTLLTVTYCDLRMSFFPEASPRYSGRVVLSNRLAVNRLDHLDTQVLNMIRQAPW